MVAAHDGKTCLLHFDATERSARAELASWYPDEPIERSRDPGGALSVLARYFGGDIDALDEVVVEMNGTDFQKRVWQALRRVKAGRTSSYRMLARQIGSPAAVRAVGAANGANPVAIIVPCHRIIGADGSLTGYGGGLRRKEWLLRHEKARLF
jgi:methylated-DNA-[protein]-cysteine S-methyltransferase